MIVAESPAKSSHYVRKNLFDSATAKLMSARSREVRQRKKQEAEELRKNPPAPPPQAAEEKAKQDLDKRVREVNKRIDEVTLKMSTAVLARDVQALSMSLRALYEVWSLLTGHPRPGIRRPEKRRSSPDYAAPME